MPYKTITVRDLCNFVKKNAAVFPKGLDTQILAGDDDGNYLHREIGLGALKDPKTGEVVLSMEYEMHEGSVYELLAAKMGK